MSSDSRAISVVDLGKAYDIGTSASVDVGLRESFVRRLRHPFRPLDSEEFWALRNLSFEIGPGEVVGIIGRNGAGKSTLLKLLSRITLPTEGHIDLWGRTGSLLEVGTGFHRELTGRENIYLNGAILGMKRSEIDSQFDAIVDFAGTEKFLDTPVKRYSSGMYVRLAFSVAAHLDTEILLVDEVLSVGDVEFQKKCLGKMDEVAGAGRTILFVSHKMGTIRELTDRAIYLRDGSLRADGPTHEVVDLYIHDSIGAVGASEGLGYFRREENPDSQVRIEAIRVSGPDHQGRALIREPLEVEIDVRSGAELRGASVSVVLHTEEGEPVVFLLTRDDEFPVDLGVGLTTLRCQLGGLHLLPGRYMINVGINRQVGTRALDAILDYPALEVSNSGGRALLHRGDRPGLVLVPAPTWSYGG